MAERAEQWIVWGEQHNPDREATVKEYEIFTALESTPVEDHDVEQVDKDVHRTYPEVDGFGHSDNLQRLRRILLAVSYHHEGSASPNRSSKSDVNSTFQPLNLTSVHVP